MNRSLSFLRITALLAAAWIFLPGCRLLYPYQTLAASVEGTPDTLMIAAGDIKFGVLGDWGRNGRYGQQNTANALAKEMAAARGQFMVSTGDNFYPAGVKSVQDPQWITSFEKVYDAPPLQLPWYVAAGNHDHISGLQPQIDYSRKSARWHMPSPYFQIHVRCMDTSVTADLFFIDSSPFEPTYYHPRSFYRISVRQMDTIAQRAWITRALAGSRARYKIVIGHHPMYSAGKRSGGNAAVRALLLPLMQQYGAYLYLCGHEHQMEASGPEDRSVLNLISGAGSELRKVDDAEGKAWFAAARNGFAMVQLGSTQMEVRIHLVGDTEKSFIREAADKQWRIQ